MFVARRVSPIAEAAIAVRTIVHLAMGQKVSVRGDPDLLRHRIQLRRPAVQLRQFDHLRRPRRTATV
jgi:hypothetical protein